MDASDLGWFKHIYGFSSELAYQCSHGGPRQNWTKRNTRAFRLDDLIDWHWTILIISTSRLRKIKTKWTCVHIQRHYFFGEKSYNISMHIKPIYLLSVLTSAFKRTRYKRVTIWLFYFFFPINHQPVFCKEYKTCRRFTNYAVHQLYHSSSTIRQTRS